MPNSLVVSFADKSGKSVKNVEGMWSKAVEIAKEQYNLTEKSKNFYAVVVGLLKKMLNMNEDGITTANMGAYQHYSRVGTSADAKFEKDLDKRIRAIVKRVNLQENELDRFIKYFAERSEDVDSIIESALDMAEKYFKLKTSIMDDE